MIVPFHGTAEDARRMLAALADLELRPGDSVVVADNTADSVVAATAPEGFRGRIAPATQQQSSYHARNVGAEASDGAWLLFIDSDCRPDRNLIDAYFSAPLDPRCGIVAGTAVAEDQGSLAADYARSRGHVREEFHLVTGPYPAGMTANLLVRRAAWSSVGGFHEWVVSGADLEFCWRVQQAGWTFAHRPEARVGHAHPDRLRPLLRKGARYAAGRAWINRRYKGVFPRPPLARPLARCAAGVVAWSLLLRFRRALYKAIDALWIASSEYGYLFVSNRAERVAGEPAAAARGSSRSVLELTDIFPAVSESFISNEVLQMRRAGRAVRVEALARPRHPNRAVGREIEVSYLEDDTIAGKLAAAARLALRHPIRCLRDRRSRDRWAREEEPWPLRSLAPAAERIARNRDSHIHVNFAAGAAMTGMRLSALGGVPYSVATHGYDIFRGPTNLEEKLRRAAFVTTACDYTLAFLRDRLGDPPVRLHKIMMGVDPSAFARSAPHPGGRTVVAVGRYVEKKGFGDLIRAAAIVHAHEPLERVIIAGDGPLRGELESLLSELGLEDLVELRRAPSQEAVVATLELADVFAMPCVVAADGDRDSMPVVVKEAMAMEVPVVASDEVGLPEMVMAPWGALAPPGDPESLAAAIADVLSLPAEERARRGAEGREWIVAHCTIAGETGALLALIDGRDLGGELS